MNDVLIFNEPKGTWMDTTTPWGEDDRSGARIEIQAMQLLMYDFYKELCGKDKKSIKEINKWIDALKNKVRNNFFDGEKLADGLGDFAQRPNIFLAYYMYPELLKNDEWEKCFTYALNALWLEWGGLSTIDRQHRLYCGYHTGKNNQSYHRGDSWYYINNIAAICMLRVNKEMFKDKINAILTASVRDIKEMGFSGYHSEISSAEKQEPFGCFAQAWSSATFIELCHEIVKK